MLGGLDQNVDSRGSALLRSEVPVEAMFDAGLRALPRPTAFSRIGRVREVTSARSKLRSSNRMEVCAAAARSLGVSARAGYGEINHPASAREESPITTPFSLLPLRANAMTEDPMCVRPISGRSVRHR